MEKERIPEENLNVKLKSSKWIENFWYHYKWHTVSAVAVLLIFTILILQMFTKTSYDVNILYAGHYEIERVSPDGEKPPYSSLVDDLKNIFSDYNNDGNVNISLLNLLVMNESEVKEHYGDDAINYLNSTLIKEDTDKLFQIMVYGDYYLCLLSERLFLEYDESYGDKIFSSLTQYISEGQCEMINERGIYLSSLNCYTLDEFKNLPSDTVVCLRRVSEIKGVVNKDESMAAFKKGEKALLDLISYKK